ncbi:hypothetical protein IHE56_01195 [Streptomyces sp. ID01-12c]|nr:hypothetical protein [Streptomyces caniscabiei]
MELLAALRRGTTLVAGCPAKEPTWQAWVAVSPGVRLEDRLGARNPHLDLIWVVREWHPDYLANDLCWAEDDGMHTLHRATSRGEDELKSAAAQYGGVAAFDYPWRTDYPG